MQHVTWSLRQQFQFLLSTSEQCASWCGTPDLNNLKDSCPVNTVARITLKIELIGHGYRIHHAGCPTHIHCMWVCTILLAECVHMICSLNDQSDLILQELQVPLICYDVLHKDQYNKSLLADCTPHVAFCRME